jgi:hypothetical protein
MPDKRRGSRSARVWRALAQKVRRAYREDIDLTQQSLLVAWLAFGVTFGITRAITYWLRAGHGPCAGGVTIGGRHIHHYNLGIASVAAVGAVGLCGLERHRRHPVTATAYGSGIALIVDELALLIDLQDVYWAKEGRRSVDAAIATISAGGLYLGAAPFWHQVCRHLVRTCAQAATGQLPTQVH